MVYFGYGLLQVWMGLITRASLMAFLYRTKILYRHGTFRGVELSGV